MDSTAPPAKSAPIVIVGAGVFGLSTAYHFSEAGYSDITLLERGTIIPSQLSAGNDINKIIRADYEDAFYTERALDAMNLWNTSPIFKPYYHETGFLLTAASTAPKEVVENLQQRYESVNANPHFKDALVKIDSADDVKKLVPALSAGSWSHGYFNGRAGYSEANKAMKALYEELQTRKGIKFITGQGGYVTKILQNSTANSGKQMCTSVQTASGSVHHAKTTILCLGAHSAEVVPSLGEQAIARGYPIAHVELTEEEALQLKNIPVIHCFNLAYFFPPDLKTGVLKISTIGMQFTNFGRDAVSKPREDSQGIPAQAEALFRTVLQQSLPALAEKPFVDTRLCWTADSANEDFVIDFVPDIGGVIAVTGDTNHGFKMMPAVGKWVRDVLESGKQEFDHWKWKKDKSGIDFELGKEIGEVDPR